MAGLEEWVKIRAIFRDPITRADMRDEYQLGEVEAVRQALVAVMDKFDGIAGGIPEMESWRHSVQDDSGWEAIRHHVQRVQEGLGEANQGQPRGAGEGAGRGCGEVREPPVQQTLEVPKRADCTIVEVRLLQNVSKDAKTPMDQCSSRRPLAGRPADRLGLHSPCHFLEGVALRSWRPLAHRRIAGRLDFCVGEEAGREFRPKGGPAINVW